MALTITAVDNATIPSGITVTVSGSGGGNITVYAMLAGDTATGFYQAGTRIGNGTVNIPVNPGYYFLYAKEGATLTLVLAVMATNGLGAVLTAIRAALKGIVDTIALTTPAGTPLTVIAQWTPDDTNMQYPALVLTQHNTRPTREYKVVGTADKIYPTRMMLLDRVSRYDASMLPAYDLWRERITNRCDGIRLQGAGTVLITSIEEDLYTDQPMESYELMISQWVVNAKSRESIGYQA